MLYDMLRWLALLAVAFGGLYWFMYGRKGQTKKQASADFWRYDKVNPTNSSYPQLVKACLGNRDKAERLIAYERQRERSLNREKAIVAALERLQYDRS